MKLKEPFTLFLWGLFSVLLVCSLSAEENITITAEQWESLKAELKNYKEYYEKSEALLEEREQDYKQRLTDLSTRETYLSEREKYLNERVRDLKLRESFLDVREKVYNEQKSLLEKLKKRIATLEREAILFKVFTAVGGAGAAAGWIAFSLK